MDRLSLIESSFMIKITFCLRRLPSMSQAEFQRYWLEQHAPLVREVAAILNMRRYVQSHSFTDQRIAAGIDARQIAVPPYDGIAELWWDSIEQIIAAGSTKEGRAAGRRLLEDEQRFIDLPNSPLFYSREHEIIALE